MRNQIDLLGRNPEDILQDARRVSTHDDKTFRTRGNPVHHCPLVKIRFTENCMQRCDDRHLEKLQQLHDVAPGFAAENSKFMLQANHISISCIQEVCGCPVAGQIAFADLKSDPVGVRISGMAVIDGNHRELSGSVFGDDRIA